MDRRTYIALARELSRPLADMSGNLAYILDRQRDLDLQAPLRRDVERVCGRFGDALREVEPRLQSLCDDLVGGADPDAAALQWMRGRVRGEVQALDPFLRGLPSAEGDAMLLSILLYESAANIVNAFHDFGRRIDRLERERPPRPIERHVLACAVCGDVAVRFELFESADGQRGLRIEGIVRGEAANPDRLLDRIRRGEWAVVAQHLPEGLDAYCGPCGKAYCRVHYQIEEEYDEGFYDCTRATCPAGHRRMIDD